MKTFLIALSMSALTLGIVGAATMQPTPATPLATTCTQDSDCGECQKCLPPAGGGPSICQTTESVCIKAPPKKRDGGR